MSKDLVLLKLQNEIEKRRREYSPEKCILFDEIKGYCPKPGGQSDFWKYLGFNPTNSINERMLLARGGRGSGKSYGIGAAFICSRAYQDPNGRGLISANSYGQLQTSTLVALAEFCRDFNIPLEPKLGSPLLTAKKISNTRYCRIFDADIIVLAASSFQGDTQKALQSGRGQQIRSFWGDEWAYAEKIAIDNVLASLGRGDGEQDGIGVITTTINVNDPYNWVYDLFDDPEREDNLVKLFKSFNLLTSDNDEYDEKYIDSMKAAFTDEMIAIELMGEYMVTSSGKVFDYWNRNYHIDGGIGINRMLPIHVSFDFNKSPATAIISQINNNNVRVLNEFYLNDSNTFELANSVRDYLRAHKPFKVCVTGDASGSSGTSNSRVSDWEIIRDILEEFTVSWLYPKANPSVIDTVNSCNSLLKQNRILVHPDCKELIKDFESLRWVPKVKPPKINKKDIKRSHLGDCFRYLIETNFPLTDIKPFSSVTQNVRFA